MQIQLAPSEVDIGQWFVGELNPLLLKAGDWADVCQMMACLCKHPLDKGMKEFFDGLQRLCEVQNSNQVLTIVIKCKEAQDASVVG